MQGENVMQKNHYKSNDTMFDEIDGQYKEILNTIKHKGNSVIIVGAGKRGKEFVEIFKSHNIEVLLFMDNDKNKWETMICDIEIRPLQKIDRDVVYFVSVYGESEKELKNQLINMGVSIDCICFSSSEIIYDITHKKQKFLDVHREINFAEWHLSVIEERPYAIYLIQLINSMQRHDIVVEIGCGVGDLLSKINSKYKIGYDISSNAIEAGQILFPELELEVGSFNNVKEKNIDVLIAVNFLHMLEENDLTKNFEVLFKKCFVKYILVDSLDSEHYKNNHDYNRLLLQWGYKKVHESRKFEVPDGYRKICLFEYFS